VLAIGGRLDTTLGEACESGATPYATSRTVVVTSTAEISPRLQPIDFANPDITTGKR